MPGLQQKMNAEVYRVRHPVMHAVAAGDARQLRKCLPAAASNEEFSPTELGYTPLHVALGPSRARGDVAAPRRLDQRAHGASGPRCSARSRRLG